MSPKDIPDRRARAEQMRKERERAEKRRRNGITAGIVAIVAVLIAVAAFGIYQATSGGTPTGDVPRNTTAEGGILYDAEAAGGEVPEGTEPVEVVAYEDFICPACNQFEQDTRDWVEQNVEAGVITMEYRPIGLLDAQSTTGYSSRATAAAACVVDQEGAAAFHDYTEILYDNQPAEGGPGLSDDDLSTFAQQAGAGSATGCIDDGSFTDWAADVTETATIDEGISASPTILVAGEQLDTSAGYLPSLQQAVLAASSGDPEGQPTEEPTTEEPTTEQPEPSDQPTTQQPEPSEQPSDDAS